MTDAQCAFCDLDGFRANSTVVVENGLCLFANSDEGENETLCGSGLIVPKAHKPTVFDLDAAEVAATFELLHEVRPLLDERYRPDGYTIGWNCYAGSGQAVMHAHLHILVRYADEPHAGKGIRWFYRQGDNRRLDPAASGTGAACADPAADDIRADQEDPFGHLTRPVVVVDATPQWSDDFERLAEVLDHALDEIAVRIDHIGSTSVAGLPAKDVIDVQVAVRSLHPNQPIIDAFASLGFTRAPGPWNMRDQPPPDCDDDPAAWDKLVFSPPPEQRVCNVHVRVSGSANARRALLFRDYLRADSTSRRSWGKFKQAIARHGATLASYGQIKQPATDILMREAERWADATGWDERQTEAGGTRLTERLRLEPIGVRHSADLYRLHQDPAINQWWGTTWTPDDAAKHAAGFDEGWIRDGVSKWMAYDRHTSALIGRGGLTRIHLDGADRLEVGWAVLGTYWGNGYATEIGAAALDFAFDHLHADHVVAFTEPHNQRSRAVMERLGMTYRHDIIHDSEHFVLYAIDAAVA